MKIAFITRSTLYDVPGGDTVQVLQTARFLQELGIHVDICPTHEKIDYNIYDLFHYFNITRPADILFHTSQTQRPYVVSPVLVDYREYDRLHRKGISGYILRNLSSSRQEYAKTMGRWLLQKDTLRSKHYIWKGQRNCIRQVLDSAAMVLPNSLAEYKKLEEDYGIKMDYTVIPNGIDTDLFYPDRKTVKDDKLVLCAARIEGIKNQLNLIRALNNTRFTLLLVGSPAPNQQHYYAKCRKIAADNIIFHTHVPQARLAGFYR
jgi:glycosyltransferase involved in cell wall biosynthesis